MTTKRTFSNHKAHCIHSCWFPPGSWNHINNFNFGQCVDLGCDWWIHQQLKVGNETLPVNVGGDTELGGGRGKSTAPQIPKKPAGRWGSGMCLWAQVCLGFGSSPAGFPAGAGRESQASRMQTVWAERGQCWDQPFQLPNSRPWAAPIPENLCVSAQLLPRESLAALSPWEPAQSHTGEDISAFTGTEPPQICVFCWFSLCFAL